MKLTLNPYSLIFYTNETLNFITSDFKNPTKLIPNDKQIHILDKLYQGNFFDYDDLCTVFEKFFIDTLIQMNCLVSSPIDTNSIYSRTDAFFLTHNMPQARDKLKQKKVLILGCGGIGTHLAWHMTTLGIAKLTLVDFDTVEMSNLNRQLLYDISDIGKKKVEVLKEKLMAINGDVKIDAICSKISSEKKLEEICLYDEYDLIIKALDSPLEIPIWLDNVAQRNKLTYITGITMRENVLIGPSFIPNMNTSGWSELTDFKYEGENKVYGTAPSLGIMLYHISDELAIEAFKILTGYGKIKYANKILVKNLLTEKEYYISKENSSSSDLPLKVNSEARKLLLDAIIIIFLTAVGAFIHWIIPICLILSMLIPFIIYKTEQEVVRCTFLNAVIFSIDIIILLLRSVAFNSILTFISISALIFIIHSGIILFMCVINFFAHNLIKKIIVSTLKNARIK